MRLSDKLTMAAVLLAIILLGVLFIERHHPFGSTEHATPLPTAGYYVGVAEANEIASYKPIDAFAKKIGRQPNIVLYYSAWGDPFEIRLATAAYAHKAVPFVQIDPGHATMAAIAAGQYDTYLRSYADQVRAYGHSVIIGFAAEMNGDWDSWGWRHTRPATWIAAWRHFVTIFRQQAANNVTWIWTIDQINHETGRMQDWWPGASYVTWIGIDGYYHFPSDTFASLFGQTIAEVRMFTDDPVLLSETAIGQVAGQVAKVPDLFTGIRAYHLLGFVWFDQFQDQGVYHQDWRLIHPAALAEFRSELKGY
jgi:Glycosyl hydrolase family 26